MGKREKTEAEVKAAEAQAEAVKAAEAKAKEVNGSRSGKGTRVSVGMTRGRNPQVISFEEFDESLPETLPVSMAELIELTKPVHKDDESVALGWMIDGFNLASYTLASDPIAEFIEPTWDDDTCNRFRLVIRNYSVNAKVSIEDAVALIKPGIMAAQVKATPAPAAEPVSA